MLCAYVPVGMAAAAAELVGFPRVPHPVDDPWSDQREHKRRGVERSVTDAGTVVVVCILAMGPHPPSHTNAHTPPAARTMLQHTAETADGPVLASAVTRFGFGLLVCQTAAEVDIGKWTGTSAVHTTLNLGSLNAYCIAAVVTVGSGGSSSSNRGR
jgi:hypothetical protein